MTISASDYLRFGCNAATLQRCNTFIMYLLVGTNLPFLVFGEGMV